jgi:hypothetical protein
MKGRNTPEVAARFAQLNGIHRDEVDLDEDNASVQTGAELLHPRSLERANPPTNPLEEAGQKIPERKPGHRHNRNPHQESRPRTQAENPD